MEWFDKDKRFDELFGEWFDNEFRRWLLDMGYTEVDAAIDDAILKIREQVDSEFENWKKEQ